MDKKSKSLIKYLISHGGCRYSVSFSEGIENVASEMNINTESLRATVRYLHDNGYIDYQKFAGTDRNAAFALSHKGENWKYFCRKEIIDYIADKWIDFFAALISVISLVISIISALS